VEAKDKSMTTKKLSVLLFALALLMPVSASAQDWYEPPSGHWVQYDRLLLRFWNEDHQSPNPERIHQGWVESYNLDTCHYTAHWLQIDVDNPEPLVQQWADGGRCGDEVNYEQYLKSVYGIQPQDEPTRQQDGRTHRGVWCHDHRALDHMMRKASMDGAYNAWRMVWSVGVGKDLLAKNWGWVMGGVAINMWWPLLSEGLQQEWNCRIR
jgi:hypothetical protein